MPGRPDTRPVGESAACPNVYCRNGWVARGDNESGGAPASACMRCNPRGRATTTSPICVACGGTHWTDAEAGGQCINCGATHPNMIAEPCSMVDLRDVVAWLRAQGRPGTRDRDGMEIAAAAIEAHFAPDPTRPA